VNTKRMMCSMTTVLPRHGDTGKGIRRAAQHVH
jgi:hypothetical protein